MIALQGLMELQQHYPIIDVRGRGLMVAAEFGGSDGSLTAKHGTAAAITKAAVQRNMILLSAGNGNELCSPGQGSRSGCGPAGPATLPPVIQRRTAGYPHYN